MNKKNVIYFTVLLVIAFIGLVIIQIYWINNSILLREQEFDYNVNKALNEVVLKLEEFEVDSEKKTEPFEIEIVDTDELYKGKLLTDNFPDDSNHITLVDIEKSQGKLLKQAGIIDDILKGVYSLEEVQDKDITERTNFKQLDSLLYESLQNKGLKAKYQFVVLDYHKKPKIVNTEGSVQSIIEHGYRKQLYPNRITKSPHYLWIYFPHIKRYLVKRMWVMLAISVLLLTIIIIAFWYSIKTIFRQKELSVIKNDFINNMTHELKTPISTITLACEALKDPDMLAEEDQMKYYLSLINEENKRLGLLVENVLRSSVLDQGEMELKLEQLNIHDLLKSVIKNIAIQVRKKGGSIALQLEANSPVITGDIIHLTNMVYNLIDNALKYSNENPIITISTKNLDDGIELTFKDNGIGISKENQDKIFERLYRVPTGNLHNVKGFGLGLSYVQAIINKHTGSIKVKSELGKGSEFKIFLPKDSK